MNYLCLTCGKDRDAFHFKLWLSDKVKARRCDCCLDDMNIQERIKKTIEADAARKKALLTKKVPILAGYAVTPTAERKREIRKALADLADERLLRYEIGDL